MGKEVRATLLVEVVAEFEDDISDEDTVRYLVEQDLEDIGWQVDRCEIASDDKEADLEK